MPVRQHWGLCEQWALSSTAQRPASLESSADCQCVRAQAPRHPHGSATLSMCLTAWAMKSCYFNIITEYCLSSRILVVHNNHFTKNSCVGNLNH